MMNFHNFTKNFFGFLPFSIFLLCSFWGSPIVLAHKAHVHGEVEMNLAFEGEKGRVQFQAPAEAFYGFEHEPKNPRQKQTQDEAIQKLREQFSKMVVFQEDLGCQFQLVSVEIERARPGAKHADVVGQFDIQCEKNPKGSKVKLALHDSFRRVKLIKLTLILDSDQKSHNLRRATEIQL